MTLSLDADTKILTVTVNGTSKTVDLSGIGGGMKQIKKNYTNYSTFASDLDNGNIPLGAEVYFSYYLNNTNYRVGHFYYMSSERANPGSISKVVNGSASIYGSVSISDINVPSKEIMIDVLYWE